MPKKIRLTSTHYFIIKLPDKKELQRIAFDYSSDTDFQDFMNLCKIYTAKPYSVLVTNALLRLDNPLRFRKNLLKRI